MNTEGTTDPSLNNESNSQEIKNTETKSEESFKKPILVGKVGRLAKKLLPVKEIKESKENSNEIEKKEVTQDVPVEKQSKAPPNTTQQPTENSILLPYKEPSWSGLPESNGREYVFDVLKNGSIVDTIPLMSKPYWVFGRLACCNICMQHPTISRYHAILQYRKDESETEGSGFYIYDLGSTHGTFLNKNRLKPKVYVRMQVGHMLKLGCSTRAYILNGPEYDVEEESELSVTELKQKKEEERRKREQEALRIETEKEERRKKEEERGVDWGLGEDADEETDLSENPFAQTNNEELYLDDPKKALRGFFEREGVDLEYDCTEQGMGQFLCKVELPLDDEMGRPIVAEVLHKGKKKEAVIQCALEACKILDRYGVLRQATHESRKRKAKNWEENDYYDSDEDTFLDRTGTIEKKREKRMYSKAPQTVETYESLLDKERAITNSISDIEKQLASLQDSKNVANNQNTEEDPLDTFMKELKQSKIDKQSVSKLKVELAKLRIEHANVLRLLNLAKPTSLPQLVSQNTEMPGTSKEVNKNTFPMIGKRKKIKVNLPPKSTILPSSSQHDEEEDDDDIVTEEEELVQDGGKEEESQKVEEVPVERSNTSDSSNLDVDTEAVSESVNSSSETDEEEVAPQSFMSVKMLHNTMTFKKFEAILKKGLPPFADKHQEKLEKILGNLKKLASNEDRMHVDWKMLAAKKRKVMKLILDLRHCEPNERLEHKVSSELNRILMELNAMTQQKYKVIGEVKKMGNEIRTISSAIDKDFKQYKRDIETNTGAESSNMVSGYPILSDNSQGSKKNDENSSSLEDEGASTSSAGCQTSELGSSRSPDDIMDCDEVTDEKKKKKNQRRIQQRQEKADVERRRGYEEDASRDDYSMWVPPNDQTGDGRTTLNDKFGY
ncbi:hypothetical protein JTB14_009572 [Gonioctena quinquepunctata]|nr:hypothetical protein JTB14_009572 [Gonioctena quinquepunctata]